MRHLVSRFIVAAVSILFINSIFAISLFGTGTNHSTAPTTATPTHVMTPDEFSSRVSTLSQQTKANLTQQASDALPKMPSRQATMQNPPGTTPPPGPAIAGQSSSETPTTPESNANNPPTLTSPPPLPNTNVSTSTTETPPPPPPQNQPNGGLNTPPPPPPPQNQPYTGFGTGNTNTNATTTTNKPPSTNTGGWNIKY